MSPRVVPPGLCERLNAFYGGKLGSGGNYSGCSSAKFVIVWNKEIDYDLKNTLYFEGHKLWKELCY